MKKAFLLLLTGWMMNGLSVQAQQRQYTMAEATNGLRQQLAPERLRQFEWLPEQNAYSIVAAVNGSFAWVKYTPSDNSIKADTLLRLTELNQQLFSGKPLRGLPALHWMSASSAWFSL
ncbi:hypothetical protein, partial [Chitinophaga sp.]|uniref:hypothetical protein n=1 Tax=Chitinophaga sp. TaxID=1869181 RepID=UPI002F929D46